MGGGVPGGRFSGSRCSSATVLGSIPVPLTVVVNMRYDAVTLGTRCEAPILPVVADERRSAQP